MYRGQPASDNSFCSNPDEVLYDVGGTVGRASQDGADIIYLGKKSITNTNMHPDHDPTYDWDEVKDLFGWERPLLRPTYVPAGLKIRSHHIALRGGIHHIPFADQNHAIEFVQYRGKITWQGA